MFNGLGRSSSSSVKRELTGGEVPSSKRLAEGASEPAKTGIKPPMRTTRQSLGGPADLSRPTLRPNTTRMSMGGLADIKTGKENVRPSSRSAAVSSAKAVEEPAKPAPQLTAGFFPEGEVSPPSLVREQAKDKFDAEYVASLTALLATKVGGKASFGVSKDKEQTSLITNLKAAVTQMRAKQMEFVQSCLEVEEGMNGSTQSLKLAMESTAKDKQQLSVDLQASNTRVIGQQKSIDELQAEKAAWLVQRTESQNAHALLTSSKEATEKKLEHVAFELQQSVKLAEFRAGEVEKARESLESKKKEIAELQTAHRAAEVSLQQSFNEKMDNLKSLLFDANAQTKVLQEGKTQLEARLQEAAVRAAQMQGEAEMERNKVTMIQRELDRAVLEAETLKGQLAEKGTQFVTVMEGFQRSQKFHEERLTEACAEKKELNEKIWALQSKKEELEALCRDTKGKLDTVTKQGEDDKLHLESALALQTSNFNKVSSEFATARQEWAHASAASTDNANAIEESLTSQRDELTSENQKLTSDLHNREEQIASWTQKYNETAKQLDMFKKHAGVDTLEQLERLCKVSVEAEYLRQQLHGKENLAAKLLETESSLKTTRDQLFQAELARRNLHNQIQELKGNVRVYVRVRPSEAGEGDAGIECEPDNRSLNINSEEGKEHGFQFDHVWSNKANQADVFNEVAPLVQSSLDGYNVCLFSYGQTGSGKTFTMQGANMGDSRGIIPRSIEKIMDEAGRLTEQGWQYRLEVTFLEIYNENVRDLLLDNSSEQSNLQILMNPEGGCHVPDLTRIEVTDRSQIDGIMRRAAKHRSVASTNMNSRSSRSHSVFTLHLTGTNELKNVVLKGSLNLCDLAGSERLDKSGATGDRLKETQAINKSLSCLAGVFASLASKNNHIPYRDSKLTYLLQQCFSAQGKTLMLVNLSPASASCGETLCSLRFARQVNNVDLGRPVANQSKRPLSPTKRQSSTGLSSSERPPSPKRNRSAIQR